MSQLPVFAILDHLKAALTSHDEVILEAPPGAGKTTCVPLALLGQPWLQERKIIMLEPRRLAARAAAQRMAQQLGEQPGETVGYRVRLDSRVSAATRIEVVTEGILVRMLQDDPSLEDVGLVIFDEFHERNLDADLGLALCLQGRELFRDEQPLKLLLMSATLDGENLQQLLPDAPLISSEGRMFPVDIEYLGDDQQRPLEQQIVRAVQQALEEQPGSILVFLPGQGEIRRAAQALQNLLSDYTAVDLMPLFGDLDFARQQQAIAPAEMGRRKLVLATAIAETSLTIDGVRVVIDAGLSRYAAFDPATGMSRLHTRRLSRAASVQRAGRAGRTEPGICYRLWSKDQQDQLAPYSDAEILNADLTPLILQLYSWGVTDPAELEWLDLPPKGAVAQARQLLVSLGALQQDNAPEASENLSATALGEQMAAFPLHPRLARMLILGHQQGQGKLAADIAALLSERRVMEGSDFNRQVAWLQGDLPGRAQDAGVRKRIQQLSQQFLRIVKAQCGTDNKAPQLPQLPQDEWLAVLLSHAYPDRIAARRDQQSYDYLLSNGRAVRLRQGDGLQKHAYLVVAESGGKQGQSSDQVFAAVPLSAELLAEDGLLTDLQFSGVVVAWDERQERLCCEQRRSLGAIVLQRRDIADADETERSNAIISMLQKRGIQLLNWQEADLRLRQRLAFMHRQDEQNWPDMSEAALLADMHNWLAPYLGKVRTLAQLKKLNLAEMLLAKLDWQQQQTLQQQAPVSLTLVSGAQGKLDYSQFPPVLAVRLQEMFGCTDTPKIGLGTAVTLHLLSPAQRPLQVTQDLASFWQNSYRDVQKDMKGRYPKHYWPDDPLAAVPGGSLKKYRRD